MPCLKNDLKRQLMLLLDVNETPSWKLLLATLSPRRVADGVPINELGRTPHFYTCLIIVSRIRFIVDNW